MSKVGICVPVAARHIHLIEKTVHPLLEYTEDIILVADRPIEINLEIIVGGKTVGEARELGKQWLLDHTDAKYILQTDADAKIKPEQIDVLMKIINLNGKIGAVAGIGKKYSQWFKNSPPIKFTVSPGHFCCLYTRELAEIVHYDPELVQWEDTDFAIQAWLNGYAVATATRVIINHPIKSSRVRNKEIDYQATARSAIRLIEKYSGVPSIVKSIRLPFDIKLGQFDIFNLEQINKKYLEVVGNGYYK